ncbi:MAG: STAS domain-containing protein [Oleispira sp.]
MQQGKIEVANKCGIYVIKLSGDVRLNLCSALERYLDDMFLAEDFKTVLVDLSDAEGVDSTTLGQLAKISIISKDKFGLVPSIITPRADITRILLSMGFDKVFYLIGDIPEHISDLNELACEQVNEELMRDKVITAHKILMSLNEDNKNAFQELVDCLQAKK